MTLRISAALAACILATCCGAALSQQRVPSLRAAPGAEAERVAPQATVIATAHWQQFLMLDCTGANCIGEFSKPVLKRRVTVSHIACNVVATAGSVLGSAVAELASNATPPTIKGVGFLTQVYSSPNGEQHMASGVMSMEVRAGEFILVGLGLQSGGTATQANCQASGIIETLQ